MPSKKRSTPSSSKNISIGGDVVNSVVINGDNNVVNYFTGEYVAGQEAIMIGTLIQWAKVDADEDEVTRLVAEE
jgi:hypothetical protein